MKTPKQKVALRGKAFNNKNPRSSELKQFSGSFWGQRNLEKKAGNWDSEGGMQEDTVLLKNFLLLLSL